MHFFSESRRAYLLLYKPLLTQLAKTTFFFLLRLLFGFVFEILLVFFVGTAWHADQFVNHIFGRFNFFAPARTGHSWCHCLKSCPFELIIIRACWLHFGYLWAHHWPIVRAHLRAAILKSHLTFQKLLLLPFLFLHLEFLLHIAKHGAVHGLSFGAWLRSEIGLQHWHVHSTLVLRAPLIVWLRNIGGARILDECLVRGTDHRRKYALLLSFHCEISILLKNWGLEEIVKFGNALQAILGAFELDDSQARY